LTYKKVAPPWEVERRLLVREEAETSDKYGIPPDKRPLKDHIRFGYVNLDKPAGPSSHEVTAWVKKILGVSHAGHGGTLETPPGVGETPL